MAHKSRQIPSFIPEKRHLTQSQGQAQAKVDKGITWGAKVTR